MSELRSFDSWNKSLRNFEWLTEACSGAMDIDVFIERKGQFLVIEGKPWQDGVDISYGQHKALYALSKQPNTTVYLVGEAPRDVLYVACFNSSPAPQYVRHKRAMWWPADRFQRTTKNKFKNYVEAWWKEAEAA
jgi:hypothetical protein